jgi:hypothetical protein
MAATFNLVVLAACMASVACSGQPPPYLDQVQERIARAGSTTATARTVERSAHGATVSWDVYVSTTWDDYRERLLKEFRGDFTVVRSDARSLTLSRVDGGDVYRLDFRALQDAPAVRVHITFSATAD